MAEALPILRDDARLAAADGRLRGAGELRVAAARVAAALPAPTPGSCVAFAFDRDRFAFAAALLGAWRRGHAVALPASARFRHVGPVLARREVVVLLHDTGAGTGIDVPKLLAERDDTPTGLATAAPLVLAGPVADVWPLANETARDADALARAIAAARTALALQAGAQVAVATTPGFPPALVPGLLAPLAAGATIVDAATAHGDLHALVAPRAFARTNALRAAHTATVDLPADDPRALRIEAQLLAAGARDAAVAIARGEAFALVAGALADGRRESAELPLTVLARTVLPRDADGQIDAATILHRHGRLPDGAPVAQRLTFARAGDDGERALFTTTVPHAFFAFAGHFPTYPVLSGVGQLHAIVLPCLRLLAADRGIAKVAASAFTDLKFLARIAPGDAIAIALRWPNGSDAVEFTITRGDVGGERCSVGRATLRASAQAGEA